MSVSSLGSSRRQESTLTTPQNKSSSPTKTATDRETPTTTPPPRSGSVTTDGFERTRSPSTAGLRSFESLKQWDTFAARNTAAHALKLGNNGAQPLNHKRVDDAVKSIKSSLSQGILDWDVSKNDLQNIQKTVQGLNRQEFNATIGRLSNDDLKHMMGEVYGSLGGLDANERQAFFKSMMEKASPAAAGRLAKALDATTNVYNSKVSRMDELGQTVAGLPADQQARIVDGLRPQLTNKDTQVGRTMARSLGQLAKTNPAQMHQQLGKFNDAQMKGLVDQGIMGQTSGLFGYSMDAAPIENIGRALGQAPADLKAKWFRAVNDKADGMASNSRILLRGGGAMQANMGLALHKTAKSLVNDSGKLLAGDTENMMSALRGQDKDGAQLQNFMANVIELNRNGRSIDPAAQNTLKQIAGNLQTADNGLYFARGLANGVKELHGRLDREGTLMNVTLSAMAGIIGTMIPGVNVAAGAAIFGGASSFAGGKLVEFIQNPTREAYDRLQQELLSQ